jgi:hypothetical protein
MKIRHAIALLTYSLAAFGCAATNADTLPYPTLKQDGTILPSVCVPTELRGLKEQFAQFKYKDGSKAWKAITTLLCGAKTDENTRYIRNMMAAKIVSTSDYTGQDNQPETINASNEVAANLFALGVAYDASIVNLPGGMFRVLYTTNEVCVEGRTFKYSRNKWLIVGTGEACD